MSRDLISETFSTPRSLRGPFSGLKITFKHDIYDKDSDWEIESETFEYKSHSGATVYFEGDPEEHVRTKVDITLDPQDGTAESEPNDVCWKINGTWVCGHGPA